MAKCKVGVLGASGYGGSDLLRLLLFHPHTEVVLATAHQHAGKRVDEVHPNLRGFTDLVLQETKVTEEYNDLDCLIVALPHGQSMHIMPQLPPDLKVVDLTGDYRLSDQSIFETAYKREHMSFSLQSDFVYGLTEINHSAIKGANKVSNPGCFATASLLGLYPLIATSMTSGKIVVDAKTGSSGSGNKPSPGTHHPKRANSFYSYKPFKHQHVPEVVEALQKVNPNWGDRFIFQTHSAPMVRGIFASIYVTLNEPLTHQEIGGIFKKYYEDAPFVRLLEGSPDVNWVKTTNFADIGWAVDGEDLNVFVAIDNLMKGAAGQAIQNMNLMFGFEEKAGLFIPGTHP